MLFQTSSLQKNTLQYPSIGQKKLNAASSRMMVYFMMTLSNEIFETHPQDVHRPGGPKFDYSRSHRFLHNAWSLQMLFPYFSYSCIGFWLGPFKKIFCNLTGGSGMSMHHLEPSQSCLQSMGRAKCQIP